VIAETGDDVIKRLNEWKDNMENIGMSVGACVCVTERAQTYVTTYLQYSCSCVAEESAEC